MDLHVAPEGWVLVGGKPQLNISVKWTSRVSCFVAIHATTGDATVAGGGSMAQFLGNRYPAVIQSRDYREAFLELTLQSPTAAPQEVNKATSLVLSWRAGPRANSELMTTFAEPRSFEHPRFEGAQASAPREMVGPCELTPMVDATIWVRAGTAPALAPALQPHTTAKPRLEGLAHAPQPPQPQQQQQAATPESRLAALEGLAQAQLTLGTAQLPAAAEARIANLERQARAPAAMLQLPAAAEARLAMLEARVQAAAALLQLPAEVEARIAAVEGKVQVPAQAQKLPAAAEGRIAVLEGLTRAQLTLGTTAQLSAAAEARIAILEGQARAPAAPLQLPAAAEARLAALEGQAAAPIQLPPAVERRLAALEGMGGAPSAPPQLPAGAEARLLALEGLRGEVQSVRELLESLLARQEKLQQENLPNKRAKRE